MAAMDEKIARSMLVRVDARETRRTTTEQPRREINLHVYRPAEDYRRRKRIEGGARVGSRFLETRL